MSAHRLLTDLHKADYTQVDPGASGVIRPDRQFSMVELVTAAAETRTLPSPSGAGLQLALVLKTDGGDCVITAAGAINETGNTIITFANTGEVIVLLSIPVGSGYLWRVIARDGPTLS